MKFSIRLQRLAEKNNVAFKECSEFHIQLKAVHTLNVYESTSSFYINGMKSKESFNKNNLDFLIKVSKGEIDFKYTKEKQKRKTISKSKKNFLWQKNPVCFFCLELINEFEDASIEHKIPLSRGGSNRMDNLALSHVNCNQERGSGIGIKNKYET